MREIPADAKKPESNEKLVRLSKEILWIAR